MTLKAFCSRLKFVAMLLSSVFILADSCDFTSIDPYVADFTVNLIVKNNCLATGAGSSQGAMISMNFHSFGTSGAEVDLTDNSTISFGRSKMFDAPMHGNIASKNGELEPSGPTPYVQIQAFLQSGKKSKEPDKVLIGTKTIPIKEYYYRDEIKIETSINGIDSADGAVQCLTIRY